MDSQYLTTVLASWQHASLTRHWINVQKTPFSFVSLGLRSWPLDMNTDEQGQVLLAPTKTLNVLLKLDKEWA